jgi:division protein CdvB (Snf7/Vps24/ESCRT-III family)
MCFHFFVRVKIIDFFIGYDTKCIGMSIEINQLFIYLEQLRKMLEEIEEKIGEASALAVEISGEFEQELSTDLDEMQVSIRGLLDDLDSAIDEGKTLWEDEKALESSLRAGLDDEENYKVDAEHIQEEMRQNRKDRK